MKIRNKKVFCEAVKAFSQVKNTYIEGVSPVKSPSLSTAECALLSRMALSREPAVVLFLSPPLSPEINPSQKINPS